MGRAVISLHRAVEVLESIAPLSLAEPWDNVGLLVEPLSMRPIETILCTIDLTEVVLDEAIAEGASLVVAYHPPIFDPLKRVLASEPRSRVIARALSLGIAIHSPHTALDSAPGGVNDWLADGFPSSMRRGLHLPQTRIVLPASSDTTTLVGQGRFLVLDRPAPLAAIVARLKKHLGLRTLRVAKSARHDSDPIATVALCAGAGGSVIADSGADLLVTGEMGHHHVLAAVARGASVVLSEHTHTERGYLPSFAALLASKTGVRTIVSRADRDPLAPA